MKLKDFFKLKVLRIPVFAIIIFVLIFSSIIAYYFLNQTKKALSGEKGQSLDKFASCAELSNVFKESRKSAYKEMDTLAITPSAEAPGKGGGGSEDHSNTNVQVEGVDEADFVKNDGEYIYTISQGNLNIVKAYPVEEAKLIKTIKLTNDENKGTNYYNYSDGAKEMFIDNNKLLIIGSRSVKDKAIVENLPEWYTTNRNFTFIKTWDLSDRENPKLVRDAEFEGEYNTSRKIGDKAYIVINSQPEYSTIQKDNEGDALVPLYSKEAKTEVSSYKPTCECQDIEYIKTVKEQSESDDNYSNSANFTNILTVSIQENNKDINRRTILGNSETVYSSLENMYLTSTKYSSVGSSGTLFRNSYTTDTEFHKFKLEKDGTDYLSSSSIKGELLNQFSMDEYNDNFRVALTDGEVWNEKNKSKNNVYILDKDMKITGKIENIAPGEKIYSMRFVQNRGYMVTFKKIDPFFVLDLKDPKNPSILGYLKIPGYSDYLHPYDENHIIGLGKNTAEASTELKNERSLDFAWYQGLKMALFDVTDVANPKEMYKTEIGDRGSDSYALTDHKAFLFEKNKNLLAIPVLLAELSPEQKSTGEADAYGDPVYQGSYVYDLTLENGFKLRGRVSHYPSDKLDVDNESYYYSSDNLAIKRTLYIGDNLYTISDKKILINNIQDLTKIKEINL